MKLKLKNGMALPNNWKSCGCTAKNWADLNDGKSIELNSIPNFLKDKTDVVDSTSKPKKEKGDK